MNFKGPIAMAWCETHCEIDTRCAVCGLSDDLRLPLGSETVKTYAVLNNAGVLVHVHEGPCWMQHKLTLDSISDDEKAACRESLAKLEAVKRALLVNLSKEFGPPPCLSAN